MTNDKNFTEGKIIGPLMKFALPVMFALFLQAMYGAVDLMVVGKFSAAEEVSASSGFSCWTFLPCCSGNC